MSSPENNKTEKRLATLEIQTEKQKKSLIVQLRKTPIVQLACERTDVGRSTYDKWRAHDLVFARAADQAIEAGRFFVNDLAESKLIRLIQNDNLTAIIFWLKHNHPKYTILNRVIREYEVVTDRLSVEEKNVYTEDTAQILARKMKPQYTVDELREHIEEGLKEAEENTENKRKRYFEEESGEK